MTAVNKSLKNGLSIVNDGLLDYHQSILKKIETITVAEAETGRLETLMNFKDNIELIIDAIHKLGGSVEDVEALLIEHGVTTNDIS